MARPKLAITKHTLNLREGDFAKLQELFSDTGGAGFIIRRLVSTVIDKLESRDEKDTATFKEILNLDD